MTTAPSDPTPLGNILPRRTSVQTILRPQERAASSTARPTRSDTERPRSGPFARLRILASCALEGAVDDVLGEDPELDVALVGVAGEESERLVVSDAVALHQDAYSGADVCAG